MTGSDSDFAIVLGQRKDTVAKRIEGRYTLFVLDHGCTFKNLKT